MKIYDISMEIKEDIAVWKNKESKKPKFIITARYGKDSMNESRIDMDLHTGTHADAFFHMLAKGKTIEKIPLEKFIGNCIVLDFTRAKNKITINDIKKNNNIKKIKKEDIVLLKTRKSPMKKFDYNFTYLEKTGAKYLADKNLKLIGIDTLGIERNEKNHDTHKILFKKNIPVIEGLELSKIRQGRYFFIGLPLKIKDADASPLRAVLFEW
ncbi:cyclase family protein [Candidatus Woesearchaeota archaeon]|nr:cyclase family protein [Candidatus Woesearchaeota archaeon]